ncbi:hypothetical protein BW41_02726 [Sphingomonas sp. RIT328]|nr:hypothetical protein BW41_02699 [Sphingomonas sp. RIT328]EZP51595.1 hypothetical protein BW41_02726 [Sphingomonas sp. RIT328]
MGPPRRAQDARKVHPPADLLAILAREIDRATVDRGQHAGVVAGEALGEGRFGRGGRAAQRADRIARAAVDVIGRKRQIAPRERLERDAELDDVTIVGGERGIAAGALQHRHRRARHRIVDARLGDDDRRIELLQRRRDAIFVDRGDHADPGARRPVEPIAEGRERTVIGDPRRTRVQIGGEVAETAEEAAAPAGQRHVEADLPAPGGARRRARPGDAGISGRRAQSADVAAQPQRHTDVARRHREQPPHQHGAGAAGVRSRHRPLALQRPEQGGGERAVRIHRDGVRRDRLLQRGRIIAAVGHGARVAVIVIGDHRQLPPRRHIGVERRAEMPACGRGILAQRLRVEIAVDRGIRHTDGEGIVGGDVERRGRQPLQGGAGGVACTGIERGGHRVAHLMRDRTVERPGPRRRHERAIGGVVGDPSGRIDRAGRRDQAALALAQRRRRFDARGDIDPVVVVDAGIGDVGPGLLALPRQRAAAADIGDGGADPPPQDEIDDLLLRVIAIFERDLLGQDVDAQDRLGRQVADLVDAGDPLAVDQHDRAAAAVATLIALRLAADLVEQFGDGADAIAGDIGGREAVLGGNVADHRTGHRAAGDDDILVARGGGRGGAGRRLRGRRAAALRRRRRRQRATDQQREQAGRGIRRAAHRRAFGSDCVRPISSRLRRLQPDAVVGWDEALVGGWRAAPLAKRTARPSSRTTRVPWISAPDGARFQPPQCLSWHRGPLWAMGHSSKAIVDPAAA